MNLRGEEWRISSFGITAGAERDDSYGVFFLLASFRKSGTAGDVRTGFAPIYLRVSA